MGCNIGLSTIFILSSVIVIFGGHFRDRVCDRLLPNNRVSTQDYLNHIATLERFLIIYSRKLNPSRFSEYGKAKRQFEANGDYNVLVSGYFRDDPDECNDLGVSEFNVTEVIEVRKTGKCRKVDKYYRMGGDDQRIKTRFISQDLSKYFWFFECKEDIGDVSDVSSYEACTGSSVLELHIKDTRVPPTLGTDLNLNMFPWGLAIQDLKDFTGLTFSDLEYKWLGKECNDTGLLVDESPTVTVETNSFINLD